jgi:hypothetical protein
MNGGNSLIVSIAASALLGAIVGFSVARRFPRSGGVVPLPEARPDETTAADTSSPPVRSTSLEDPFIAALSDAEIDALPAELPVLLRPRPRVARAPRTLPLDRL